MAKMLGAVEEMSLEAANAVAVGKTRAREQSLRCGSYSGEPSLQSGRSMLSLQIHGDAAFTGQGVVHETLALADVPHFTVGGSVHFIINNQIGYTTEATHGRSSLHCSDVGLMNGCPIIHVNGDFPEEVVKACHLAMEYRHRYHKDVFVNYVCYRRWGHNEMDEPAFTQPLMYRAIRTRPSVPDQYAQTLQDDGVCEPGSLAQTVAHWNAELQDNLKQVDTYVPQAAYLRKHWTGMQYATDAITTWDTGVEIGLLQYIGTKSVSVPPDMFVHPTLLKTYVERRLQQMEHGKNIDWATAESLAIGSLLYQGFHVRLSGQDVGRGTFSHRHVMLVDQDTDAAYIPLNSLLPDQTAFLEVANSPLSEEAVVGFEYGMSIEHPRRLVVWEAQFGDFSNGAQIITDTCITGGETKWMLQSGLVMLLPHGLDGAGPEHSSCRIERFLQSLCPFPAGEIQHELAKYSKAKEFVWSQEEHRNQGAWSFVAPRFENIIGRKLRYAGRGVLATPAAGIGEMHQEETQQLLVDIFTKH